VSDCGAGLRRRRTGWGGPPSLDREARKFEKYRLGEVLIGKGEGLVGFLFYVRAAPRTESCAIFIL